MEEHDRGFGFGPNAEAGPSSPRNSASSSTRLNQRSPSRSQTRSTSVAAEQPRPRTGSPESSRSRTASRNAPRRRINGTDADSVTANGVEDHEVDDQSDALSDIDDGHDPRGLRWYLSDLGRHIKGSLGALEGRITAKDGPGHNHFTYTDLSASTVSPSNATWTPAEKSLFFAALSRHSRHRPDLIAADVRTKTEAQVHEYLSALRWEASKTSDRKGEGDESKTWRNHLLWTGAYEISEEIADREAVLAETIEARATTVVPDRKRKRKAAAMSDTEQLTEWGRELDTEKLHSLATLLRDAESRDKGDLEEIGIQVSSDAELETEDPIAKDNAEIVTLQSMAKKDRTPAQRTLLRTLLNRKAARERSRMKTLASLGFTPEQITAGGGPDAMYASHIANDRPKKKKGARRKSLTEVKATDGEVQRLAELGADAFLTERGWEVFNYARVAQLMGGSGRIYDSLPSAKLLFGDLDDTKEEPTPPQQWASTSTTTASFAVVSDLYAELLAYLKPLVYASVLVAEQQVSQTGGQSVTVEHVMAALGLRGELGKLREISSESRMERSISLVSSREGTATPGQSTSRMATPGPDAASGTESARGRRRASRGPREMSQSPEPVSWTVASAAPLFDRYDSEESDSASDMDIDLVGDDPKVNGGLTDIEDEELDAMLHVVDRRLDAVMSTQISVALRDDDPSLPVDEWIWARPPVGRLLKRVARDMDDDLAVALDEAQEQYCETVKRIASARRARALAVSRAELFPRTRQIRKTMSRLDQHPWKNSRLARAQAARVKRERGDRGESAASEARDREDDSDGEEAEDERDDDEGDEDESAAEEEDELDSDREENNEEDAPDNSEQDELDPSQKPSTARLAEAERSRSSSRQRSQSSRQTDNSPHRHSSTRSSREPSLQIKQSQHSNPGHHTDNNLQIKQSQHSNPANQVDNDRELDSVPPSAHDEEEQDELNSDSSSMKREIRSDPARASSPIAFRPGWSRTPEEEEEDIKPVIPSSSPPEEELQSEPEDVEDTQDHVLDTQHTARDVDEIEDESRPRSPTRSRSGSRPSIRSSSEYDWDD